MALVYDFSIPQKYPNKVSVTNSLILCNTSNTRDNVSSGYSDTEKRVENTPRSGVYFDEIRGVSVVDGTLS